MKEWSCYFEMRKFGGRYCGEEKEFILEILILRCLLDMYMKILGREVYKFGVWGISLGWRYKWWESLEYR